MKIEAKILINMADSIAKINNWSIDRLELQKHEGWSNDYYDLHVTYESNKKVIIHSDCTIVWYDD
jgi:hypothetical protein